MAFNLGLFKKSQELEQDTMAAKWKEFYEFIAKVDFEHPTDSEAAKLQEYLKELYFEHNNPFNPIEPIKEPLTMTEVSKFSRMLTMCRQMVAQVKDCKAAESSLSKANSDFNAARNAFEAAKAAKDKAEKELKAAEQAKENDAKAREYNPWLYELATTGKSKGKPTPQRTVWGN